MARPDHWLLYGGYLAVARPFRLAPRGAVRATGGTLGALSYYALPQRRRLTLDNLASAFPEWSDDQRRRVARASYRFHGTNYFETFWSFHQSTAKMAALFDVEGVEHLEAARARGKGLLLLASHYGAADLSAHALASIAGPIHLLVQRQTNPLIAGELQRLRTGRGEVLIERRRSSHRMLNVLRRGGTVALAIDQRVRPWDGILDTFLGQPAWSSTVPAQLSSLTGTPAVPLMCIPAGRRFRLVIDEPIETEGRHPEALRHTTRRYLAYTEEWIRRHPELWLWPHTRWRRTISHYHEDSTQRIWRDSGVEREVSDPLEFRVPLAVRAAIDQTFDERLLQAGHSVLLAAPNTNGLAAVARILARSVLQHGFPVLYRGARQLAGEIHQAGASGQQSLFDRLDRFDLLVVLADAITESEATELEVLIAWRRGRRSIALVASDGATLPRLEPDLRLRLATTAGSA